MNKTSSKLLSLFLICCLVLGQTAPLLAGPQDGKVVAGSATIRQESPTKVGITQTSDRVAINWQSFNIGANEHVQFYQPSSSSVALNRVVGPDASSIMGRLTANGQVFLVNPNGIIFGKGSQVDASGLMASTHNIRNEDFMAGRYLFNIPGKPGASIINEGIIRIADTGVAAFVAPAVANRGIVAAKLGKVALASANGFTLDFFGDQLLTFMVNDEVAKMAYDVQGNQLTSFVENSGRIEAQGGYVLLSAKAAEGVVHNVINQSGVIEATSVGQQNGEIILSGGQRGVVSNTGTLDASGKNEGESGGKVQVTGEKLGLFAGTAIDVSGYAGGGKALIGGDYLGGRADDATMRQLGISRELFAIQTATYTNMAQSAYINADALHYGKGGKVVLWSDDSTRAYGRITANGGSTWGDGGFVEVSGRNNLDIFGGSFKAKAKNGMPGTVLYDPLAVYIESDSVIGATAYDVTNFVDYTPQSSGYTRVAVSSITNTLNTGTNVYIRANSVIAVQTNIIKTAGGDASLTLRSTGEPIAISRSIKSTSGKLSLTFDGATDSPDSYLGSITWSPPDHYTISGGNVAISGWSGQVIDTNGGSLVFRGKLNYLLPNSDVRTNGGNVSFYGNGNAIWANSVLATNGGNVNFYGNNNIVKAQASIITNKGNVNFFGTGDQIIGTIDKRHIQTTDEKIQTESVQALLDRLTFVDTSNAFEGTELSLVITQEDLLAKPDLMHIISNSGTQTSGSTPPQSTTNITVLGSYNELRKDPNFATILYGIKLLGIVVSDDLKLLGNAETVLGNMKVLRNALELTKDSKVLGELDDLERAFSQQASAMQGVSSMVGNRGATALKFISVVGQFANHVANVKIALDTATFVKKSLDGTLTKSDIESFSGGAGLGLLAKGATAVGAGSVATSAGLVGLAYASVRFTNMRLEMDKTQSTSLQIIENAKSRAGNAVTTLQDYQRDIFESAKRGESWESVSKRIEIYDKARLSDISSLNTEVKNLSSFYGQYAAGSAGNLLINREVIDTIKSVSSELNKVDKELFRKAYEAGVETRNAEAFVNALGA